MPIGHKDPSPREIDESDAIGAIAAYEREPYLRNLDVEIVRTGERDGRPFAVLSDTLLYPEGGGQPSDRGRLGELAVLEAAREGGEILHFLNEPAATGPASLRLDWERRWDHMQQHTAQHLLTALALDRFGWATTSFHLGPEISSIDLDTPRLSREQMAGLETAALAEIAADRPVTARRVSRQEFDSLSDAGTVRSRRLPEDLRGDIRLIEIEGIDVNTCGGTHVSSLGELRGVKLLGTESAHGGCRLSWVAGDRILRRLGEQEARIEGLRSLFETSADELLDVARLKLDQLGGARRRIRELETAYAEAAGAELALSPGVAEAHFDGADGGFLQQVAKSYSNRPGSGVALLTASSDKGAFFALAAGPDSAIDLRQAGASVAEALDGRGGGSGRLFQGKAGSLEKRGDALRRLAATDNGTES